MHVGTALDGYATCAPWSLLERGGNACNVRLVGGNGSEGWDGHSLRLCSCSRRAPRFHKMLNHIFRDGGILSPVCLIGANGVCDLCGYDTGSQ